MGLGGVFVTVEVVVVVRVAAVGEESLLAESFCRFFQRERRAFAFPEGGEGLVIFREGILTNQSQQRRLLVNAILLIY